MDGRADTGYSRGWPGILRQGRNGELFYHRNAAAGSGDFPGREWEDDAECAQRRIAQAVGKLLCAHGKRILWCVWVVPLRWCQDWGSSCLYRFYHFRHVLPESGGAGWQRLRHWVHSNAGAHIWGRTALCRTAGRGYGGQQVG